MTFDYFMIFDFWWLCVTNSRNIIPLFHKKVPLQKIYPNLARRCKNKFYENKIKLNWLNLLKFFYYSITDKGGAKNPSPTCQVGLIQDWLEWNNKGFYVWKITLKSFLLIFVCSAANCIVFFIKVSFIDG